MLYIIAILAAVGCVVFALYLSAPATTGAQQLLTETVAGPNLNRIRAVENAAQATLEKVYSASPTMEIGNDLMQNMLDTKKLILPEYALCAVPCGIGSVIYCIRQRQTERDGALSELAQSIKAPAIR